MNIVGVDPNSPGIVGVTPLSPGIVDLTVPTGGILVPVAGRDGQGIAISGVVDRYADLPSTLGPLDSGIGYLLLEDGLAYFWSGTAWPAEGNGAPFKGDRGDPGRGIASITGTAAGLQISLTEGSPVDVTVPAIQQAAESAAAAASSVTAAATQADRASANAAAAEASADRAESYVGGVEDGAITNASVAADAEIEQSKIAGLTEALAEAAGGASSIDDLTGVTPTGLALAKAEDGAAARTAIDAASLSDIDQKIAAATPAIEEMIDTAVGPKYSKPSDGIPGSDLAEGSISASKLSAEVAAAMGSSKKTRIVSLTNGGQGSNTSPGENLSDVGARILLRPNGRTKRWRIAMRIYHTGLEYSGGIQPAITATGKGIKYGRAAYDADGYPSGMFEGNAATTLVSTDFAVPGDKSYVRTEWVTAAGDQLDPVDYLFATGWQRSSATTVYGGTGWNRRFTSAAAALDPTQTSSTVGGGIPFDLILEYEVESSGVCGLFVGDSITEGVGAEVASGTPIGGSVPWHKSWPQSWAVRTGNFAVNLALSSTAAVHWTQATDDKWTRVDIASAKPEFGVIALGANNVGTALATFKTQFRDVMALTRSRLPVGAPVFIATITPRNASNSAAEAMNVWFRTLPYGAAGVVDFGSEMSREGNLGLSKTTPPMLMSDGLHLTRVGMEHQAAIATWTLPGRVNL